jgi:hypothetical protein
LSLAESTRVSPLAIDHGWAARLDRAVSRDPGRTTALVLFAFAFVWLTELARTSRVPAVDNLEQLIWSRGLAWGYYKHPPLPTVLMRLAVELGGLNAWTSYLLGAATILGGLALYARLLRELRGPRYAHLGLLAALCITFYNGRLNWYNHNTVLLVLVAALALFAWRAFERGQLRWWFAAGMALGLGALTKYQVAVTGASLAWFWLARRGWEQRVHRVGALLAVLVALVLFTPHLLWLRTHDFGPVTYAMDTSLGAGLSGAARTLHALNWLADAVLNRAGPALLLLGIAGSLAKRHARAAWPASAADRQRWRASRQFLFAWGVVPLLFVTLLGTFSGADLQMQWSTSFLLFLVPCVMELAPAGFWDKISLRIAWPVFAAVRALLLVVNVETSPVGAHPDHQWRSFSAQRLAARLAAPARERLGGPIRVIDGPTAEAGALALQLPERPLVLVDGRYDRSPWVSPDRVARCGALQIAEADRPRQGMQPVGEGFRGLYWRVLPPQSGAGACREAIRH